MATLNMTGPFPLTQEEIDKRIIPGRPGNYAYGFNYLGNFKVQYVGRSDTNLHARISHGIGQYDFFKFSYASNPKEAFEKECKNFHDFGGRVSLYNNYHPDRPDGTDYSCPRCDIFDDK